MIYGNWVAIHKAFSKFLPVDRPYSKVEAMFSLSIDADNKNFVSVAGYAKLWSWSRNKVVKFLDDNGVTIEYPENIEKKQNQKGQIKGQIKDRSDEKKGQARFIIDKALYSTMDRSEKKKGQIKDRSKDTTIDPNINPDPNSLPKKSSKRQKTDPPDSESFILSISEATKKLCREMGIGQKRFKQLSESCFDHFRGKGEKKVDWEATVRNWIRNDKKFAKEKEQKQNNNHSMCI
jgi:hypothetical protein